MKTKNIYYLLIPMLMLIWGCKKDFLDKKPLKSLLVPTTLADVRALLDNAFVFNLTPGLTYIADGDLQVTNAGWNNYPNLQEKNSYIWAADIFGTETSYEWDNLYQQVFYANVALESLSKLNAGAESGELRGTALFHRAYAFYNLSEMFTVPYKASSAGSAPGIPLKLRADVNEKAGRGTLEGTYQQVLADLSASRSLLPATVSFKSRPSRAAVYGLLARVYLSMGNYPLAGNFADSCLQLRPELIDYNTLSTTAIRPFTRALPNGSPEVIFYSAALDYTFGDSSSPSYFTPEFYALFAANDLRRTIFFRQITLGNYKFKGNYSGVLSYFSGLATDEMYLIRAECAARAGNRDAALADLNALLLKRWKRNTYVPLTAGDAEGALRLVMAERRKELTQRGLRWADLRRLGGDPRFAVTLHRTLNGQAYTLSPESPRYTYPIPVDELRFNNLAQNER